MKVTIIGNSDARKTAKPCLVFRDFCLFVLVSKNSTIQTLPISAGVFLENQESFCEHHETSQANTGG